VRGVRVVPRAAEGHERRAHAAQQLGLGGAGIGVGDHERIDRGGAQELVVPVERVVDVAGEQQHVVAGPGRGLDERVQEAVHQGVAGALLRRLEAQPDHVRRAGAQLARGAVGRVAELGDRRLDALQRVLAEQLRVVQRVGDGLTRHSRALGDRGQGRVLVGETSCGAHRHLLPPG
jgi:hypothetical protein